MLWYLAHSETHGFRATRRSLAALPLKVESSYFRANVSLLELYADTVHTCRERLRRKYETEQAEGDIAMANFIEYIGIKTLIGIFVVWIAGGTFFYYQTGFLPPFGRHNLSASLFFMVNSGLSVGAGPCEPGACGLQTRMCKPFPQSRIIPPQFQV